MSASPACTARAARRSAITPEAPPVGMWSSQRGLRPRCWVTPTAVSGEEREAADGEAVDPLLGDAGALDQRVHRRADEPVRALRRVAQVGHRHRHGDGDALVRRARTSVALVVRRRPPPERRGGRSAQCPPARPETSAPRCESWLAEAARWVRPPRSVRRTVPVTSAVPRRALALPPCSRASRFCRASASHV